jgi:YidC/Oxa1 family membrane protein insertase
VSPRARRIAIPLVVVGLAGGVLLSVVLRPPRQPPPAPDRDAAPAEVAPDPASGATADGGPDAAPADEPATDAGEATVASPPADGRPATEIDAADLGPLVAAAPGPVPDPAAPPAVLGSLDFERDRMRVEFAANAAGIVRVTLSDVWETARGRRRAERIKAGIRAGTNTLDDLLAVERYVLKEAEQLDGYTVPTLGAHSIIVQGQRVSLFGPVWSSPAPGRFVTEVRNEAGDPVLEIERVFELGGFDLTLRQRITNRTDMPLDVRWGQYGPGDLNVDRSRYMDRRRFRFGHLWDVTTDPTRTHVVADDDDLLFERTTVVKRWSKSLRAGLTPEKIDEYRTLWPNKTSRKNDLELSWFASTNRYFALAIHPVLDADGGGNRALTSVVEEILLQASSTDQQTASVFIFLYSPTRTLAAGGTLDLDLGIFAGPMDRHVLGTQEPFPSLALDGLILYQMSSFCAVCTFQWLAHGLLWFLSMLEQYVVFDWGVAIILLVMVVRTLLHPITKRSQINMQRFGKSMGALKPELEKLQKKYADDPKRYQQEQLRLMREHGVNPFQMLGCLPMFLQMPIWVALYAMLYFAFDLRHEAAFYGVFQKIAGWPFLGDLSSADHFFGEFAEPRRLLIWNVTGINILPILMGVIFYIQQKYMSPPPSAAMSKEQEQQQKIMKIMMVVLFPVMLYSAPSGLTLYILTSSCIGILESRYVRRHISEMDLKPPAKKKPKPTPGTGPKRKKPKDAQGRAYADALERAKAKRRPPPKSYKKRK